MSHYKCGECKKVIEDEDKPIRCPVCLTWNCLDEMASSVTENGIVFEDKEPVSLKSIKSKQHIRFKSEIAPLDDVLGGGFVKGAAYLFSGEPGIGKTTLLSQTCENLSKMNLKTLYCSAEENVDQIKMTSDRIQIEGENVFVYNTSSVERIIQWATKIRPKLLIVDSIQAVGTDTCKSAIGSTFQVRDSANMLIGLAKTKKITTVIVAHVTKDGDIAGPKTIEHMVDAPLFFEKDSASEHIRTLRCTKNRFGSTAIRGIFEMGPTGLIPFKSTMHGKDIIKAV